MVANELMREKAALKMIRACFEHELTVKFCQHEVEVFDGGECINSVAIGGGDIPEDVALQAIYDCVSTSPRECHSVFG